MTSIFSRPVLSSLLILIATLSTVYAYAEEDTNSASIKTNISQLSQKNEEYLLKDDPSWSLFSSYDGYMEDAINILTDNKEGKTVKKIYALLDQKNENTKKIQELSDKLFSAPESSWNPLTDTQASIKKDTTALSSSNNEIDHNIALLKDQMIQGLANNGITINKKLLDFMIAAGIQEDLTNNLIVLKSLKEMTESIEQQMEKEQTSHSVKQYTAIYLVTILAYKHTHEVAIKDLTDSCSKINTLISDAKQNISDAQNIDNWEKDKILLSNIKMNQRTISTAQKYKEVLINYKSRIQSSEDALKRKINVARNVYRTVNTANSLISVIKSTNTDFKNFFSFSVPELNDMYNIVMSKEFDSISEKIRNMD